MTTISIRLPDDLLQETDKHAGELDIPRAEYIRRAIDSMNAEVLAQQRRLRIMEASRRVRDESMRVNAEYAVFEDVPDA